MKLWWAALAVDVVLVVVFAAVGMRSHEEAFSLGALWGVAWPFLAGLAAGWLVSLAWRAPARPLRSGVPIWVVTVAGGMILRAVSGAGTATSFIIVASLVLLAFLVGWRTIAAVVRAVRRRSAGTEAAAR
jgi:hypothetical protein